VDFIEDIIKIEIFAGAERLKGSSCNYGNLKRLLRQVDVLITAQDIHTI